MKESGNQQSKAKELAVCELQAASPFGCLSSFSKKWRILCSGFNHNGYFIF